MNKEKEEEEEEEEEEENVDSREGARGLRIYHINVIIC